MKITLLNTHGIYSHKLCYDGIKEAFEQIKQESSNFDFIEVSINKQDDDSIPNYNPDFIFAITPLSAGIRVWKRYRGKRMICYDTEGLYENLGLDTLHYSDIMITVDKMSANYYKEYINKRKINCKVYHMPLGFSPNIYKFQNVNEHYKSDVCLAGAIFDYRRKLIEELKEIKNKFSFRVITPKDWIGRIISPNDITYFHKDYVSPEELGKYYAGSKIILCVNRDYSPANYLGLKSSTPGRVFQETACRRMVMIDNSRPEINDYFENGKEIVVFENANDLKEKIIYYLEHEEEREAIAHNGYVRTMVENTWKQRIRYCIVFKVG